MPKFKFRINSLSIMILYIFLNNANSTVGEESSPGGQTFGDWVVRCNSAEKPLITCVMTQMAIVESSSERLMRINIAYQADFGNSVIIPIEEKSTIQITLPLGISLSKAPQIFVEGILRKDAPIGICLADGCYSTFNLDARFLEEFLKMGDGAIRIQAGSGDFYELPISGVGSRAAYNAMLTISKKLVEE